MKKPLPVEGCSSHFSCIVADMFNFFVSQVSNEAAIVSKVLSKSDCGRETCDNSQWSLSWLRIEVPRHGGEKAGATGTWRAGELKFGCSYMNHTFCFSLFLVSIPVFYSLGKILLFMHLIRSIQTHSTPCTRPSTSLQVHLSKSRDWQNV